MIVQGLQLGGRRADPLRQRRALDLHAGAREDLRLPIERQMIGVLRHDDVGDEPLGRQPALDQPRRRRRLDDAGDLVGAGLLARAAGELRPPRHDHGELGRHLVEPLRHVLADHVQRAVAARADLALRLDHHLLVRQVVELLVAARAALLRALALQRGIGLLGLRLGLGVLGLQRLQRERQLVVVDALGAAAEHGAAHLGDDVLELLVAGRELVALGGDRVALREQSGMGRALREDQRMQGVDIVGQR